MTSPACMFASTPACPLLLLFVLCLCSLPPSLPFTVCSQLSYVSSPSTVKCTDLHSGRQWPPQSNTSIGLAGRRRLEPLPPPPPHPPPTHPTHTQSARRIQAGVGGGIDVAGIQNQGPCHVV